MAKSQIRILAIAFAFFFAQAWFAPLVRSVSAQGRFLDESSRRLPSGLGGAVAVAIGDVDGDGDPDIFLLGSQRDILLLNDGSGGFAEGEQNRLPARPSAGLGAVVADIDGDGDRDIVVASGRANRILINNGAGFFTDEAQQRVPISRVNAQRVAAGDVDRDGDVDLFFANQNRVLINNGGGRFLEVPLAAFSDFATDGAFADIDGDGDLDLIISTIGQNRIFVNTGRGSSDETNSRLPLARDQTRAVALADLDGDGDTDIVFGNFGQNRILMNDGTGNFGEETAIRLQLELASTRRVIAGDVDLDGDIDLLVLNSEGVRLLMNDGAGNFADQTPLRLANAPEGSLDAALADFDGDGAPDILFVSAGRTSIFINSIGPIPRAPVISGRVRDLRTGRGIGNAAISSGDFTSTSASDGAFSLEGVARSDEGSITINIDVPPTSLLRILSPVTAPGGSIDFAPRITFSWVDISSLGAARYRVDFFFAQSGSRENFDSTQVDGTQLVLDFSGAFGRAFFSALASIGPLYLRVSALDAEGDIIDQTDFVEIRLNPPEPQGQGAEGSERSLVEAPSEE